MKYLSSPILVLLLLLPLGCAGVTYETAREIREPLLIKNLRDLPAASRAELETKWSGSEVYIIVHPSYYLFFHEKPFAVPSSDSKNIVGTFLENEFADSDAVIDLMKAYEKAEMDFMALAKQKNTHVILLIPGNYLTSHHYIFRDGPDEYTRYINELTGDSEDVIYIESMSANTGKMFREDQTLLLNFLRKAGIVKIYLGGGYVGRCQKEFYNFLSNEWSKDDIAIIPEISSFSPTDLTGPTAKMLLAADRRLNSAAANFFIHNGGVRGLSASNKPNLKNVSVSEMQ